MQEERKLQAERAATAKRIESMKREFDFISKMDAQDVNYVLNKKKEHAVLLIQRNFRRLKQARAWRDKHKRRGNDDESELEKTVEELQRIDENKKFLSEKRAWVQGERIDTYNK